MILNECFLWNNVTLTEIRQLFDNDDLIADSFHNAKPKNRLINALMML